MQIHNRSLGFNIVILSLTFLAVILLLFSLLWPKPIASSTPLPENLYTAKSVGHQVVIYQSGRPEPIMMTGIDIRTLPPVDQQALSEGISLRDATALAHLLEDYDA